MIRWTPAPLDRVFDEFFNAPSTNRGSFLPLDIHRTKTDLIVEASVPGFSPDEVDVSVDDDVLTISAQHQHEQSHGGGHDQHGDQAQPPQDAECVRHERHWGSLHRQVYLGKGLDADNASAEFEDGELRVTIPLKQRPGTRRIEVTPGHQAGSGRGLT